MKDLIIVRGGGDLASGIIYKLYKSGFSVLICEISKPSSIRRFVSFSEAIYDRQQTVENLTCYKAENINQAKQMLDENKLVIIHDETMECLNYLSPIAVVDAIIAKKNLGTNKNMAPITVAAGPGFSAPDDVDAVVETKRGHNLGKIIYSGCAEKNTGVPGMIGGYAEERVIRSPSEGIIEVLCNITDIVKKGQIIAYIINQNEKVPVYATIDGLLRGMIRNNYPVTKGFKIADIDPRLDEKDNCFTISDKARCIAGGVLEAILYLRNEKNDLCR